MTHAQEEIIGLLGRIASALEAQSNSARPQAPDWSAPAYVWLPAAGNLRPVADTAALPLDLLVGLEDHAQTLLQNTAQFAAGYPANNALLWGARGMGKSSLVKSIHAQIGGNLKLIEIHREDIATLPALLTLLRTAKNRRFILFCDDLTFDEGDSSYKALKSILEGGVEARPANILLYATSNRRHLIPRQMVENERATAIQPGEAAEEKISLSDRFGLWLGFYPCTQDQYLQMVDNYAAAFNLEGSKTDIHRQALEWSATRGARSGRVAWQFTQDLAGKQKRKIAP